MPESRVWIDTTARGLTVTLQLPLDQLETAFGQPLAAAPQHVLALHGEGLARYLLQHVGARGADGRGWQALAPRIGVDGAPGAADLVATMELLAPPGAQVRGAKLLLDVVTHEVRTHRLQVYLRNDWAGGHAGEAPLPLGELRYPRNTLDLALPEARAGAALARLLEAGALHIVHGTDHLLFLLLLVIVAPLATAGRTWGAPRPAGAALRRTAVVVTAFTLGHTATLALGSSGLVAWPARAVEIAVAATLAVAARHAWRPLFVGAEVAMAGGFGLVHGLAFSSALATAGLTPWQHAQALLAFNLGIEAMQLVLLAFAAPPLLVLANASVERYAALRRGVAALGGMAAGYWVVQRAQLWPWPDPPAAEGAGLAVPLAALAVLWAAALSARGPRR